MNRVSAHDDRIFWSCAAAAMALHAYNVFADPGLHGGGDLLPHLRLIQLMTEEPALRTTYAPAYHLVGGLLAPWLGLALVPKLFALASAAVLIGGFRLFQRAAEVPASASAMFCFFPYTFSLSWCLPKVEAAGYGVALAGLALLVRRRYAWAALALVLTFWVHTAAALLFGLAGGVLSLARRDPRGLAALTAGTAGAMPLFAAHLAAGCTLPQAFLFSDADYLRSASTWRPFRGLDTTFALANPIGLGAAALGAPALWRKHRSVAIVCLVLAVLYLNEVWLAPFPTHTTLNLRRGLTVLAIPVSLAAGVYLAQRSRRALWVIGASAVWALASLFVAVPDSCYTRPIDVGELRGLQVHRCTFRWRGPHIQRTANPEKPRAQ